MFRCNSLIDLTLQHSIVVADLTRVILVMEKGPWACYYN